MLSSFHQALIHPNRSSYDPDMAKIRKRVGNRNYGRVSGCVDVFCPFGLVLSAIKSLESSNMFLGYILSYFVLKYMKFGGILVA